MKKNISIVSSGFLAMLCLALFTVNSCNKNSGSNNNNPTTSADSLNNPNLIAQANAICHWTFNNTPQDSITYTNSCIDNNVTYGTGRNNQCYEGNAASYISFPIELTDKLATMSAFTISYWMKTTAPATSAPGIFSITGNVNGWGISFILYHQNETNTGTYANMMNYEFITGPTSTQVQGWASALSAYPVSSAAVIPDGSALFTGGDSMFYRAGKFPIGNWYYFTMTYNGDSSFYRLYANGNLVLNIPDTAMGITGQDPSETAGAYANGLAYGKLQLNLLSSGNMGYIGKWSGDASVTNANPWMTNFVGSIDELRIYNTALSNSQISALYQAEVNTITN